MIADERRASQEPSPASIADAVSRLDAHGFARALQDAGVVVGADQTEAFARALGVVDSLSRREVYRAARASFVFRSEDIPRFDLVFEAFFSASEERAKEAAATRAARLDPAWRRSRGGAPSRRGKELDMRRILRKAARHGGQALVRAHQRGKKKRRALVLLAGVSGSMAPYVRVSFQFFHPLAQTHSPSGSLVSGTRLTRVASPLRIHDADRALDRAASEVTDFAGGTRIGESLRTFNRHYAARVLRRGAVVLLVSDGWQTGNVALLEAELSRLRRRSHRLIWLNPLLGDSNYQPVAEGMAAALPDIDDFLPASNIQSVSQLARQLARMPEWKVQSTTRATKLVAKRRARDAARR